MRAALYYRVSTDKQTTDPQRIELLEYCQRKGIENPLEFHDVISGAKWSRTGLQMLMLAVRKHKIDAVIVVKLDRLGRSLPHLAQMVAEFDAHRVALIATSQGIDTSDSSPAGRLQLNVLLAVAEFEREIIRERTKAGLVAARARGSKLGRPKVPLTLEQIQTVIEHKGTIRALAVKLGCSLGTALKMKREAAATIDNVPLSL